jgi:hypothetical protein
MKTKTTKSNCGQSKNEIRLDSMKFFFTYHSGQGLYLTVWTIGSSHVSAELTLKQFLSLPIGYKFQINGSDKNYTVTEKGIE